MADDPEPRRAWPALRPPAALFPPPAGPIQSSVLPNEPLVGRLRARTREAGAPEVERLVTILESLLPDPDASLDRLIAAERAEGGQLVRHWRLKANDLGHRAFEVAFEPVPGTHNDPALIASGAFGETHVEISLRLAHANPAEQQGLHEAMAKGTPFKLIVLSHEVEVG